MLLTNIYTGMFLAIIAVGFLFRNNTEKTNRIVDISFCVTIAFIAATFFSLFPLTKTYTYADSSVFIYIGKMMKNGLVPYRDLFDHKGIWLYLIQYLGLVLGERGAIGIWILEVIHMIFTTWFMYKVAEMFSRDRIVKYIAVIAIVVMCGMKVYEGGNLTEEYALPWIAFALYIFLKYFKDEKYEIKEIVWLGIGFAVVALLRVNMIAVWIAVMPIIFVKMLFKHQYKDVLQCVLAFCGGAIIVLVPVLIYLVKTDSLKQFIECYIIFNVSYSEGGSSLQSIAKVWLQCIENLLLAFGAGVVSIFVFRKNKLFWLNCWILLVSLYFSHMSGKFYAHYGMILLPMLIPLAEGGIEMLYKILSINGKLKFKLKFPKNAIMLVGLCAVILGAAVVQYKWANLIREPMLQAGGVKALQEYLVENTKEKDDVLIVGNDAKYYLLADRKTENKYFYQTPPIKISEELYNDFLKELEEKTSDTIVVMGTKEKCLEKQDNLGEVCRYLENMALGGEFSCQTFKHFYIYTKVEK